MKSMIIVASMLVSSVAFANTPAVSASTPTTSKVTTTTASAPVATSAPRTLTAQQQKMVDCNKQATGKKGADRKTFMSTCLKKAPVASTTAASAPTTASSVAPAVKK